MTLADDLELERSVQTILDRMGLTQELVAFVKAGVLKLVAQGDHSIQFAMGAVTGSTGAAISGTGIGQGFSSSRSGTGAYTITFTTPFGSAPIVLLTGQGSVDGILRVNGAPSASSVAVRGINPGGSALADQDFQFLAVRFT